MKYRADIDGLRALAVVPVVLYHAEVYGFSGGYVGVDIFFVISGFLITSIIVSEIQEGRFSFAVFYERRMRRIFPALLAMLSVTTVAACFVLMPTEFKRFGRSVVAACFFASNVLFSNETDYFDAPAEMQPLLHTWSLAVEEQFYILLPLILFIIGRSYRFISAPCRPYLSALLHHCISENVCALFRPMRRRWVGVLIGLIVISFALSVRGMERDPTGTFYLLPTRGWELLLGCLLAVKVIPENQKRIYREFLGIAGVGLVGYAIFIFDEHTFFPGLTALVPTLGAFLIIYSGRIQEQTVVGRILSRRPLVFVGLISYSLYLWHWPVFVFRGYLFPSSYTSFELLLSLAICFILAVLSWRFIETPVRTRRFMGGPKTYVIASGSVAFVLAAFGVFADVSDGWRGRFGAASLINKQSLVDELARSIGTCFLTPDQTLRDWDEARCKSDGKLNESGQLFLIGDSFAAQFAAWFKKNYSGTVLEFTASSCPPIFDFDHKIRRKWCKTINDGRREMLTRERFSRIFLAGYWGQTGNQALFPRLESTIKQLKARSGARIYVLGAVPRFKLSPIDEMNRRKVYSLNNVQYLPAERYRRMASLFERWGRDYNITVVNVTDQVCRGDYCRYATENTPLFVDSDGHLTQAGVDVVMRKVFGPSVRRNKMG